MPDADGLGGDAQLAGDLGLADATGEQLGRTEPSGLQSFAFLLCRKAAGNGCHGRILPAVGHNSNPQPIILKPKQPGPRPP